jgi:predicted nucleotidyltransferase
MRRHVPSSQEQRLLERIGAAIREIEPDARIVLYGSRARGKAEPDSDWDLLVLVIGPVDRGRRAAIHERLFDLELETDTVLSPIVLGKEEWGTPLSRAMPFHANVEREGVEV